jgi:hypothetical protein
LAWYISAARCFALFLVDLGASMIVASTKVPSFKMTPDSIYLGKDVSSQLLFFEKVPEVHGGCTIGYRPVQRQFFNIDAWRLFQIKRLSSLYRPGGTIAGAPLRCTRPKKVIHSIVITTDIEEDFLLTGTSIALPKCH